MSRIGIVLDQGSPTCKHQSLASVCGYEYCLSCSYKFFGHCNSCAKRLAALNKFFTEDLIKEFEAKLAKLKRHGK